MTSIKEIASETLEITAGFGWAHVAGAKPAIPVAQPYQAGTGWEPLLRLDAAGWTQFLADNNVDGYFTRKLDRLVATWLTQQDYRELREIASKTTDAPCDITAETVFSEWIDEEACRRLGHLIIGMGFTEPHIPLCYAFGNAHRAVHAAIAYSQRERGLNELELEAAKRELEDHADEYATLSSLGIIEESA